MRGSVHPDQVSVIYTGVYNAMQAIGWNLGAGELEIVLCILTTMKGKSIPTVKKLIQLTVPAIM